MNVDAQEAALGLLSMGHNYLSQPTPSTSSATLNSILTTTVSPLVPQKRKQSDIESVANHVDILQPHPHSYFRLTHSPPPEPSPRSNAAESNEGDSNDTSTEAVDCICGFAVDDGFSIACDECSRWSHSACFGIAPGSIPEKFSCWACKPRSAVDKERAVRLQRERLGLVDGDGKDPKQRRRSSPGLERKQRRGPALNLPFDAAGPGRRKRRPSVTQQPSTPTPTVTQTTSNGAPEEELVDIDNEPWRDYYVHIAHDIIPNDDTRSKLRHQAAHWRGVTAVSPSPETPTVVPSSSLDLPPPVSVKPLSPLSSLNPFLSQNSNPLVLPPAFSLHTTQPISSHSFIAPFRSCVTPSSTYLADPLNSYAHLGMPKPYVHLLGPPIDMALDARIVGNHERFARWGCKPNAVLRPILCEQTSRETDNESPLGFGIFATKDMKANEEIVLGWEWDDGNAVHLLPALLEAPHTFPPLASLSKNRPHKVQHIKNQMSNILHALSSTFTTCACGALSKDCALTQMAAFVDGHDLGPLLRRKDQPNDLDNEDDAAKIDIGPLIGRKRGFRTKERVPDSGGLGGMQMVDEEEVTGSGRGVVWDGRRPYKEIISPPSLSLSPTSMETGTEKSPIDEDVEMPNTREHWQLSKRPRFPNLNLPSPAPTFEPVNDPSSEPRPPDRPDGGGDGEVIAEERMPPKMRKRWMHREVEARREPSTKAHLLGLGITLGSQNEQQLMPPPPMPASLDPTTISSTSVTFKAVHKYQSLTPSASADSSSPPPPSGSSVSPLASFAQLSLLSPANTFDFSRQSTTEGQGDAYSAEDNMADGAEPSNAAMSAPEATASSNVIPSTEPGIGEQPAEEHEDLNDPSSVLDCHTPVFSRRVVYDEDDEVDYSPHSPEPSCEDSGYEQSPQPHPSPAEPPTDTDINSHSALDSTSESGTETEAPTDDQPVLETVPALPHPVLSPTLSSPHPTTTTNPGLESEPSSNPSKDLPQPPPQKVKMTLKDFALRKRRQREEQALSQTVSSPALVGEDEANTVKAETPVAGRGDRDIMDFLQQKSSSSLTSNALHNTTRDAYDGSVGRSRMELTVETGSTENETCRNDTPTPQKEGWINLSPLPSPSSMSNCSPATPGTNSHSRVSHNLPTRPLPLLLSPRPALQPSSKRDIQGTKQEVTESVPSLLQRVGIVRSVSPISPDPAPMLSRISQEEEGEIGETSAPLSSRVSSGPSYKRDSNAQPFSRNSSQFSHSPPTAPRFYLNPSASPSSARPPQSSMSPIPSAASNNNNSNTNINNGNRTNLPTAPRALRQSMLQQRSGSGPPAVASHSPSGIPCQNSGSGSMFIPRGPLADRDKERERLEQWEQRHYRAPSRKGVGSGRGTPWGR